MPIARLLPPLAATSPPSPAEDAGSVYSLCPAAAKGPDGEFWGVQYSQELGKYLGPFVMQACNNRVVHRSNYLLGWAGQDFRYQVGRCLGGSRCSVQQLCCPTPSQPLVCSPEKLDQRWHLQELHAILSSGMLTSVRTAAVPPLPCRRAWPPSPGWPPSPSSWVSWVMLVWALRSMGPLLHHQGWSGVPHQERTCRISQMCCTAYATAWSWNTLCCAGTLAVVAAMSQTWLHPLLKKVLPAQGEVSERQQGGWGCGGCQVRCSGTGGYGGNMETALSSGTERVLPSLRCCAGPQPREHAGRLLQEPGAGLEQGGGRHRAAAGAGTRSRAWLLRSVAALRRHLVVRAVNCHCSSSPCCERAHMPAILAPPSAGGGWGPAPRRRLLVRACIVTNQHCLRHSQPSTGVDMRCM